MGQNTTKRAGRPRNPDIEDRAIEAAYDILAESGFQGLSFLKVSALSGIARPTLKLRWRSRVELCIDTIKRILDQPPDLQAPENLTGQDVRQLIVEALEGLIVTLNAPDTMRILASAISVAHFAEPMNELRQYVLSRRGIVLRRLIQAGIDSGEFAQGTDVELTLDLLNGPILYRTLILGMTMNKNRATQIVDSALPPA